MPEWKKRSGKIIKKSVRQWSGGKARPYPKQQPRKQPKPSWVVVGNVKDNPELLREGRT